MKKYIMIWIVIFLLACFSSIRAQEPENDTQMDRPLSYERELMKLVVKSHTLEEMPIGYAEDFPLYSTDVRYIRFTKYPERIQGKKYNPMEEDPEKNKMFEMKQVGVFSQIIPLAENEDIYKKAKKVRKWFQQKAKIAGYKEVESVESDFGEYFSMKYEKSKDNIYKKVEVEIKRGRVYIRVFKDEQIKPEPVPFDVSNDSITG